MNFQYLHHVESADTYIDIAFRAAKDKALKKAEDEEEFLPREKKDPKGLQITRLSVINRTLTRSLNHIVTSFPRIDELPPFYNALVKCTLDYPRLKRSLGAMNWAVDKVDRFCHEYSQKIRRAPDFASMLVARKSFYGRVSSTIKQIDEELQYLEYARKTMKAFPNIKTSLFSVAIVGFPNVGKTTLLTKLTPATPEIAEYAFTTQRLNTGYMTHKHQKIQLIDTPGTLNRFDKMNQIEQQAELAIRHVAQLLVYVFDLTESSFPLADQLKLYERVKRTGIPMVVYLSKNDVVPDNLLESFSKKYKAASHVDELKEMLATAHNEYLKTTEKEEKRIESVGKGYRA